MSESIDQTRRQLAEAQGKLYNGHRLRMGDHVCWNCGKGPLDQERPCLVALQQDVSSERIESLETQLAAALAREAALTECARRPRGALVASQELESLRKRPLYADEDVKAFCDAVESREKLIAEALAAPTPAAVEPKGEKS